MAANTKEGTDFMIIKYFFKKNPKLLTFLGSTQFTFLRNLEDHRCVTRMLFFFFKQYCFWRSVCFIPSVLFSLFRLTLQVIPIPCTSLCQLIKRTLGLILWKRSVLIISKRFHSQWVVKVKIQQNFLTYILLNAEIQMVPCENSAKEVSY